MISQSGIYKDIATRTGGDIYIGIVGPVRTGKSTFIKRFMENCVLPQIEDAATRSRATDEMPQSGSGKAVMTTEPKFVPDEAVRIEMESGFGFRVKLIDCVGFPIADALGLTEENEPRLVNTPWSESAIPFEDAATLGTQKVIRDHATIGIVITTDGSIGDFSRDCYTQAEEKVILEMKETGKPFIILVNSQHPESDETISLCHLMQEKYRVAALPINAFSLTEEDIHTILKKIVLEFPLNRVLLKIPKWVLSSDASEEIRDHIDKVAKEEFFKPEKTGDIFLAVEELKKEEMIERIKIASADLGTGKIAVEIGLKQEVFYRVLSQSGGMEIRDEEDLILKFGTLAKTKAKFDKIEKALNEVDETGYGIVTPSIEDLTLEEPEIVKQAGGYGVKLKASAPSIHMIKANIRAEISPIVGSERQSEDIVKFLLEEFEEDPAKIWQSNMFGKSLYELVNEGLNTKLNHMPQDARGKLAETLQKIINDGSGGLICIIL